MLQNKRLYGTLKYSIIYYAKRNDGEGGTLKIDEGKDTTEQQPIITTFPKLLGSLLRLS